MINSVKLTINPEIHCEILC